MSTYDKIKDIVNKVEKPELSVLWKTNPKAFTRERNLGLNKTVYFILNKRGQTLEMEIDNFKQSMGNEWEKVTKSAICQRRKDINPEIFKDLNRDYIINTYKNQEDYKTYKGYIVFAIDGMDIEIPNVKKAIEVYGS